MSLSGLTLDPNKVIVSDMGRYPNKEDQWMYGVENRPRREIRPYRTKSLGMVSGVLELLEIETKWSPYYKRDYRTGWCTVRCLACRDSCEHCQGQPFRIRLGRVSASGRAKGSMISCGCMWRKGGPKVERRRPGREVADLTEIVFGQLEPMHYRTGEGWVCACTCKRLCIATPSQLLEGTRTACSYCRPQEWNRRPGAPKGVRRPARLAYLRPAVEPTPGPA